MLSETVEKRLVTQAFRLDNGATAFSIKAKALSYSLNLFFMQSIVKLRRSLVSFFVLSLAFSLFALTVAEAVTVRALPAAVGSVATGDGPFSVYTQGRYAYVVNASSNTFQIFDVTNPALPVSVGLIGTGSALPEFIFVQGHYA